MWAQPSSSCFWWPYEVLTSITTWLPQISLCLSLKRTLAIGFRAQPNAECPPLKIFTSVTSTEKTFSEPIHTHRIWVDSSFGATTQSLQQGSQNITQLPRPCGCRSGVWGLRAVGKSPNSSTQTPDGNRPVWGKGPPTVVQAGDNTGSGDTGHHRAPSLASRLLCHLRPHCHPSYPSHSHRERVFPMSGGGHVGLREVR